MDANSMKTRVFFSYSNNGNDKQYVDRIIDDLDKAGVEVWIDRWEIKVGDSIIDKVTKAIKNHDFFIIILSQSSIKSRWVAKELNTILTEQFEGRDITVMPLLIEKCDIPLFLKDIRRADFTKNYRLALLDVLEVLTSIPKKAHVEVYSKSSSDRSLVDANNYAADIISKCKTIEDEKEQLNLLDEAETILSDILRQDPLFGQALVNRGHTSYKKAILVKEKKFLHKSIDDFKQSLDYVPYTLFEDVGFSLGRSYIELSEYQSLNNDKLSMLDHAIHYLTEVTRENPNQFFAHYQKGRAFAKRYNISNEDMDFNESERNFTIVVGLNPNYQLAQDKLRQLREGKKPENKFTKINVGFTPSVNPIDSEPDIHHRCEEHETYNRGERAYKDNQYVWITKYYCSICGIFLRTSIEPY